MKNELGLRRSTKRSYRVRDRWFTPKLVHSKPTADSASVVLVYDVGIGRLEHVRATYVNEDWEIEPSTEDPTLSVRLEQLTRDELERARLVSLVQRVEKEEHPETEKPSPTDGALGDEGKTGVAATIGQGTDGPNALGA